MLFDGHRDQSAEEQRDDDYGLADEHHWPSAVTVDEEPTHEGYHHLEKAEEDDNCIGCGVALDSLEQLLGVLENGDEAGSVVGDCQHESHFGVLEAGALQVLR